ncbi:hypothetical protein FJ987_16445 [Mesorhizobium sp. CU2]|uniref:hypothetical protein n=1 Tax=unclassified Mesorhizobium TaxID=325217 RepID=UPI0011275682|nr:MULTISPECIES: hypothetical protein [unclassified Mesorhizobium]TPN82558.1 hypothetical protein FJ988_15495 [Mesorhizobium sp. CU3]TPO12763.1 hypothetical protein FJ987_16445 [Mesorhizobium sp. CU2]
MIEDNVVLTSIVLGLGGSVVLSGLSIWRWASTTKANRALEKDATDASFDGIRALLANVTSNSTLNGPPMLRYTPRNALALESRQDWRGFDSAVVVGLQQRSQASADPDRFEAQLGHEVSHLELKGTGVEVFVRRLVALHFLILSWLLFVFLIGLGFIDRTGLGSAVPNWGFNPVFDKTIYIGLFSQFIVLALSSAVVFTYPYFYVVRREHAHDLRGSQLAQSAALVRHFKAMPARRSWADGWISFWTLHPSARARLRVLEQSDVLLVSAILYPGLVAGLQPLILLLTAGWRTYLEIDEELWNIGLTAISGLLLYLALSADFVRFGLSLLMRRRSAIWFLLYAVIAAAATQVPRLVLEFSSGLRSGRTVREIVERVVAGLATGGVNIVIGLTLLLCGLGYLTAAGLAAFGTDRPRWATIWMQVFGGMIVVCAFIVLSLREFSLQAPVLFVIGAISVVTLVPLLLAHCTACRRSTAQGLWLSTRCKCGHDRLQELREIRVSAIRKFDR